MDRLISVVLVTHNAGDYLAIAVESILRQTWRNLELVLIDNASTDDSVADLSRTCDDDRVRIFPQPQNWYHSRGLVEGLRQCRGELIAIMDADDISHPERLERQVSRLQRDPSLMGIACAAHSVNQAGHIVGREFTLCDTQAINQFLLFDMPFVFPTFLGRRKVFEEFPFRDGLPMAHDLDFFGRVVESHPIGCLPEILFSYRRHPGSTTSRKLTSLVANASVARIAKARRLASKPENLAALLVERDDVIASRPTQQAVFLFYARRALEEGFFLQAAFMARRAIRFGCSGSGISLLLQILRRARNANSPDLAFLFRFALVGTLRAYGIRPVKKN